ncbi:MAG: YkgJ family cysteine cluster protein [Terrimicrobiaceae bacterium]|nr:YkgJ family cysteine cluster protein [Terrimicrobiaceae bacterium]
MTNRPPPFLRCVRCGNCCRWPGWVRVSAEEADAIAGFLGLDPREFIASHTRLRPARDGLALVEKPDGSCVFLEGANVCLIQPVKPAQCRGFPNLWTFPGWREMCHAVEEPAGSSSAS